MSLILVFASFTNGHASSMVEPEFTKAGEQITRSLNTALTLARTDLRAAKFKIPAVQKALLRLNLAAREPCRQDLQLCREMLRATIERSFGASLANYLGLTAAEVANVRTLLTEVGERGQFERTSAEGMLLTDSRAENHYARVCAVAGFSAAFSVAGLITGCFAPMALAYGLHGIALTTGASLVVATRGWSRRAPLEWSDNYVAPYVANCERFLRGPAI